MRNLFFCIPETPKWLRVIWKRIRQIWRAWWRCDDVQGLLECLVLHRYLLNPYWINKYMNEWINEWCLLKLGKQRLKKETLRKSLKENLKKRDKTKRLYDQENVTVKRLAKLFHGITAGCPFSLANLKLTLAPHASACPWKQPAESHANASVPETTPPTTLVSKSPQLKGPSLCVP